MRKRTLLLGASSHLCLALLLCAPAQAQSLTVPHALILSVEGGYVFNRSERNLGFPESDAIFGTLPGLKPGHNGQTFAVNLAWRFEGPWDAAFGFRHTFLGTSRSTGETAIYTTDASNRLQYQEFDLELGYRLAPWRGADIRLFGGPRIVHADSEINYGLQDKLFSNKLGRFNQDTSLWAFGPRAGLEASVPLGDPLGHGPITFNASGSGAVLFGFTRERFGFNQSRFLFSSEGASSRRENRVVYNLEGSVSLGYRLAGTIDIQIGYRASHYWNLGTGLTGDSSGTFALTRSNILTHGPFARLVLPLY